MTILFITELINFLQTEYTQEVFIDNIKNERMAIEIDIIFPKIHCAIISLDSMDVTGDFQSNIDHKIHKTILDENGNPLADPVPHVVNIQSNEHTANKSCGSCYGAGKDEKSCCNSCQEVIEAYQVRGWATLDLSNFAQCRNEGINDDNQYSGGCQIHGTLWVNKVAGAFHISPGVSYNQLGFHLHDLSSIKNTSIEFDHEIKTLRFGSSYPNQKNLLENTSHTFEFTSPYRMYFLKLVSTKYSHDKTGEDISSFQYSVTTLTKRTSVSEGNDTSSPTASSIPGVYVQYEISPLMIKINPVEKSFLHFVVTQCGIVGGIFIVASFIDSFYYRWKFMFAKSA